MGKSVITTKKVKGHKYFEIFELKGVKKNGEKRTIDRYLNKKEAEEEKEFAEENFQDIYDVCYIMRQIVWC